MQMNIHSRNNGRDDAVAKPTETIDDAAQHGAGILPQAGGGQPPTLSSPQRDAKQDAILDGVRQAFLHKGFAGASMQDLARSCGMSAGNFYRYYPSKAAIVEALVARDLDEIGAAFSFIEASDTPLEALRLGLFERVEEDSCAADGTLWAEIMATAFRSPEIGAITGRIETAVVGHLCRAMARVVGMGEDEVHARVAGHATVLVLLVKGSAMHRDADEGARRRRLDALKGTIDKVLDGMQAVLRAPGQGNQQR